MIIPTFWMSIYSKVTEQDLISLRKSTEQQKNQPAPKIKNGILKWTHDIKLAESSSTIVEKLSKVKESTQKIGEIVEESNTPQLENTQNALPIENYQILSGVIYDTSKEKTLSKMIKQKRNWNRRKRYWWYYLEWIFGW